VSHWSPYTYAPEPKTTPSWAEGLVRVDSLEVGDSFVMPSGAHMGCVVEKLPYGRTSVKVPGVSQTDTPISVRGELQVRPVPA
jgi:hypothetical protein